MAILALFGKSFGPCECCTAQFWMPAAAFFGQIFDKLANAFDMQRIINEPAMPRLCHETGAIQFFQMKRQACRADA